jgi:hypothetical protein
MADRVVRVRVSGLASAVEAVALQLRRGLEVAEESRDCPNRRETGVRRYLTVLVSVTGPTEEGGDGGH